MLGAMSAILQDQTLFAALGGRATLERVHKVFYDKLYADPWLSQFFVGVPRDHIENQQTEFMMQSMGGPEQYMGSMPPQAHRHMFITDEAFERRHGMLDAAIRECGVPDTLRLRWLKIDHAFKGKLVKASLDECQGRYRTEPILVARKP
jgi:truncated hemoglobin YjbI